MSGSTFAASLRHASGLCRCRSHGEARAESALGAGGGRPFALPGTTRKYERDVPFAIEHIALDLALDVPGKSIGGTATLRVRRIDARATALRLDAVAFAIAAVELIEAGKSKPLPFTYDDETLRIEVGDRPGVLELRVRYRATPKRGLYFLAPDDDVPTRPTQVWSQCQDEDARAWFPCHDKPHVKQTTELRIRVPKGWFALSNGVLAQRTDDGDATVFHWKQEKAHPSYLVTLAAGTFATLHAEGPRGLPLAYHVAPGKEDEARRSFARTGEMIALFEKRTGVAFPWAKYDQIVVSDFIFGGMENTSATTMYEYILLDERAALDVDMDGLVAHELAHQWFGDLVTCRDWSEGWLNEGWATYMELVWKDEGSDPTGAGRDEYDYAVKGELDVYLAEDGGRYRRAIVHRDYDAPIDIFDRHLYQKGGLVLHALRRAIGDEAFWGGTRAYLEKHAYGVVESRDFQRALEAASGRSLDRIFDAYVHGAGHPELEVSVDHEPGEHGAAGHVVVGVRQTQKLDELTKLYDGPLTIEICEAGKPRRVVVHVESARDTFALRTDVRPDYVAIDPDFDLLATIELKAPADMLRKQLESGSRARVRWSAAIALAKRDDQQTIDALGGRLADEREFWGVRAEAAEALGEIRGEAALGHLRAATKARHPKVRRAVARALGRFRVSSAAEALLPLAKADPSYLVEGEAARALGATRIGAHFDLLVQLLDRPAWADSVRAGAADGLAALRDDRAVPHLVARTAYGQPSQGRRACLVALARLDASRKTRELIEERLDDVDVFVRISAIRALETLGDPKSRGALSARLAREDAPTVRRRLREALRDLSAGRDGEVRRLRDELDKLRDESQELRARLAKVEGKIDGAAKPKAEKAPAARKKSKAPAKKRR
jgi:aminopeptidase N